MTVVARCSACMADVGSQRAVRRRSARRRMRTRASRRPSVPSGCPASPAATGRCRSPCRPACPADARVQRHAVAAPDRARPADRARHHMGIFGALHHDADLSGPAPEAIAPVCELVGALVQLWSTTRCCNIKSLRFRDSSGPVALSAGAGCAREVQHGAELLASPGAYPACRSGTSPTACPGASASARGVDSAWPCARRCRPRTARARSRRRP